VKGSEEKRIREVYEGRRTRDSGSTYTWLNPATAFHLQRQEQAVLKLFRDHGIGSFQWLEILEVGCGGGSELRNFIKYGAAPSSIHGIDIMEERIEQGRALSPNIDLRQGSAERLPYADSSFDLVCQFVMFTSILDPAVRKRVASEMIRVLRPSGLIVWYDYFISSPANRDVRGVRRREILDLFPGCEIDLRKVTLAPPLARLVAPRSQVAAMLLEKLPFLRSHYLCAISKTRLP